MNELKFKCTACGDCCNSTPSMTIFESIRLSDKFISVFRITNILDADKLFKTNKDALYDHAVLYKNKGSKRHFIEIIADTIQPYATKKCSAKGIDNLCEIYEERPEICRMIPFRTRYGTGPSYNEYLLQETFFKNKNYPCAKNRDEAPVVMDKKGFKDQWFKNHQYSKKIIENDKKLLEEMIKQKNEYIIFFEKQPAITTDNVSSYRQHPLPISLLFKELLKSKIYSKEDIIRYCNNQVKLINEELNKDLSINKKDMYESLLNSNNKILEELSIG